MSAAMRNRSCCCNKPQTQQSAATPALLCSGLTLRAVAPAGLPPHRHLDLSSVHAPPALAAALPAIEGQPGGDSGGRSRRVHPFKHDFALPQEVVGCWEEGGGGEWVGGWVGGGS